jgi:NAD-dependent histone deacetylase SIR2/NAD-dependent deacetylase sirtuin 1
LPAGLSSPGLFASSNPADLWNFAFRLAAQVDHRRCAVIKPKLTDVDTILGLTDNVTRIGVLMGAGASVGQDFRSRGGL